MTSASVSSESPIAARCRVPSVRSDSAYWVSGRITPAATISSPTMITAPSWSGEYGVKIVASISAETRARTGLPVWAYSSSPTSCSTAMMAPTRPRESRSTPSTISSVT